MEPQNIEFNGIEYEAKSLIQFTSLARLLFDLAKRQKDLENTYEYINESVSDKEQRVCDLELKVIGESKPFEKKGENDSYSKKSKQSPTKNDFIKRPNNLESSIITNNISNNDEKTVGNEEALDSINGNKINSDLIAKLNKKIKDIEKKLNEMTIKTNIEISNKILTNKDNINKANNHLNKLDNNYEEIKQKLIKFNEEFDKIKVKVEDFNIYDIFKGESSEGGSIDATKALIMNLENKIFKKFSLYDEKSKKNETDLFKISEDTKNLKGLFDNFKIQIQRNNEKIGEIEKNLNDYINKNDNKNEELANSIELMEEKIKKGLDINEAMKLFEEKIKKIEEDLKKIINDSIKNIQQTDNSINENVIKKNLENLDKAIKENKKSINELDSTLNQNINNLNSSLKEKIDLLEKEIQKKSNSTDLNPINDKLYELEELTKVLTAQIDTLQEYNEKFKSELSNYNKKIEYLNGAFVELKNDIENKKGNKNKDLDDTNFISQTTFNEYKKENNIKNEKHRLNIEDLSRNVNDIVSSLTRYPTNKEFNQFQNNLLTLLEEFKINCFKKFMEKHEIHKSLRILENQIKTLSDSKKSDGSDNWLLAKKPLNNYQCASCEALLKDLEKKDNYVPWNKYPNREEKTYRMGHGFSRMLQMVNEEIIKNIENKENKGYVSDEDKKYSNNRSKYNDSSTMYDNKSLKLPKVNQKNVNNDKLGLTVNKFIANSSPYDDADSASPDEPRISKIYKINSNVKKLFGLNKSNTENQNNLSANSGDRQFTKFKEKKTNNKIDYYQMSMTQPNDKK